MSTPIKSRIKSGDSSVFHLLYFMLNN
jgi:hypothetical protein